MNRRLRLEEMGRMQLTKGRSLFLWILRIYVVAMLILVAFGFSHSLHL